VKTDSNGNISCCSDVKNDPATSGSPTVKVSNTNLAVVKDGISYLADKLTSSVGALTATREC